MLRAYLILRLSARIRGASTELQDLGEEEDEFTKTTSKLQNLVKSLTGFDIMKNADEYKSIYDIILGIGKEWDNLTDIEQASLAEALAGKRNSNALLATLGNLKTLEGAYEKAEASAGSATKEQENYQKSLQYSLDRTKASLEELSYDLLDSDMLKEGLELINEIIKAIDVLVEHLNPLTALLTGGGVLGVKGFIKDFDSLARKGEFETLVSSYVGLQGTTADFKTLGTELSVLDKAQRATLLSATALTDAEKIQALETAGLTASEAALELETYSLARAQNTGAVSTGKLGNALKGAGSGLKAFFSSTAGVITIVAAIGIGIAALIKYLDQLDDKARESISNLSDESQNENSKLESMNKELEEVHSRIDEINSQDTLTIADEEELKLLQEQNAELEKTVGLQKEIAKSANQKVISEYSDKESILNKDFANKYNNYQEVVQNLNALRNTTPYTEGLDPDLIAYELENYEAALKGAEKEVERFKGSLLEIVSSYEEVREAIISKYDNDLSNMTKSDSEMLDSISDKIRMVYKSIYSESEYRQNVIDPFFKLDEISDGLNSLFNEYYSKNGKAINWEQLLNSKEYENVLNKMRMFGLNKDDLAKGFEDRTRVVNLTKLRLEEVNKLLGNTSESFREMTRNMSANDWLIASENMADFEETLGLTQATADGLSLSFEDAKASVLEFINGTDDAKSELEDLQNALADTRNMSVETYEALISHSQKYANTVSIENGRLIVNRDRLNAVASSRIKEQKEILKQASNLKKLEYLKHFRELKMYDDKLVDMTSDTYSNAMALQDQITQLDLLSNQLDIASDSFERFKEAQSTENAPDYDTGMSAFTAITEGLSSGKVGTDDFKYAMQALMSVDQYKEFVALAQKGYDAQYDFMEKWQKQNAKFFTEDDRTNAIAWQEYLIETGLLQDGMIASSEELGKATGFSYDIVNALNENLNQFDFDGKIISQYQIDYIDEANEALTNLTNAQQAYNEAVESGADENLITSLEEDLAKAQVDFDEFISNIPEKYQEAKDLIAKEDTNLLSAMFGEDETDASAYIEVLGIAIDNLSSKAEEFEKQKLFDSEEYREIVSQLEMYRDISNEIAHANYQKMLSSSSQEDLAVQKRMIDNILQSQKRIEMLKQSLAKVSQYEDEDAITRYQQQIEAIQYSLAEWTNSTYYIDIQVRKETIENEISALKNELADLQKTAAAHPITLEMGGGYQAQQAMQNEIEKKKTAIDSLEKQKMELETTITYVTDAEEAEKKREELGQDIDTKVDIDIKDEDMQKTKLLHDLLDDLKNMGTIQVGVEVSSTGSGSILENGVSFNPTEHGLTKVNGTAHADGNWGLLKDEKGALVGELAPEGLVRDGKFYLIGKHGPERKNLKKGDVIFNGAQTAQILKNGYATERGTLIGGGHALGTVLGSAFVNANNKMEEVKIRGGSSSVTNAIDKATDEAEEKIDEVEKETEEQSDNFIDWIERRITDLTNHAKRSMDIVQKALDRVTNLTSRGGKKGTTAFKTFNKTLDSLYNTALDSQKKVIENQKLAYEAYNTYADMVGLDPAYQEKIKNGIIEIENITDEALQKQIQQYQDYYDKSQSALDGLIEAAEAFYKIPLDKAAQKIENLSNKIEYLDKAISNATNYKTRNKLLDDQDKAQKQINKAQKVSLEEAKANQKAAKKVVKQTALKETDKELKQINKEIKQEKKTLKAKKTLSKVSKEGKKEIKKATKNNEAIDLSTLKKGSKAYKEAEKYNASLNEKSEKKLVKKAYDTKNVINPDNFKEGSKAWQAVIEYNAAITATTEAYNNAKNAEEEWLTWHKIEMPKAKFDNIARDFDNAVTMIGYDLTDIQNRVAELQQLGKKIALEYYDAEIDFQQEQLDRYTKERAELEKSITGIQKYSDEWYEAYAKIKEVDNAISQLTISVSQLRDTVNQMVAESFTNMQDDFSKLMDEVDFYAHLMSHEKKTDDKIGYFTAAGLDNLSLAMQKYNYSLEKTQVAQKAVNDLLYIQEHYNELQAQSSDKVIRYADYQIESQEKLNELQEAAAQANKEAIKEQYDMYSSVVDLMKERYQSELAFYKQLISDKKESLDMEKSLYDYQKKITEKTKNLATLQKQLAAYSGDSSQEGMAKRQKLQSEITKAQEDLRDTEYDKYIQDQKDMLDSLAEEYEERIETKLEQFRELFKEANDLSQTNTQHIVDTINDIDKEDGVIPKKLQNLNDALTGSETGLKPALLTALTGGENSVAQAIKDGNSVTKSPMSDILAAIKTVNGQTATKTNAGSDPGATSPPAYTVSNTLKDVPVSDMKLPTGGLAPAATLQNKDFEDLGKATAKVQKETDKKAMKERAEKFIKKFAAVNKDGPSNGKKYSAVNQKIAEMMGATSKTAEKKKKVLTTGQLRELAGILGVVYDNASASGNLYKKLHSLGIGGFSQGGFVESVNKAIWKNGDDGIATVKVGEAILTPTDSKNLASLAKNFETIDVTADILRSLKESAKTNSFGATAQNIDYGGVNFNFDLEGVTDPTAFVHAIQTDSSLQKAIQSVSVDRINGGGRLNVQRIK